MKVVKKKIADLTFPEKNVRIHTDNQIKEFVRSIKMFGQIRPVVIDDKNVILAGNGLVMAMKEAGEKEIDVIIMSDLSENQKKKLMIADNKIFNLGIENLDTLNEFLEEMCDDLDIPGFDEDILKTMVADADEVTAKIASYGILDDKEIQELRDNRERKEVKMEKSDDDIEEIEDPEAESNEEDPVNDKFIICPKCGEKIWL